MVQSQMETRDQQIERLQSALDQSQQLQALTESRFQAEHMQLAEIRSRSFLQRLKAFEWLNLTQYIVAVCLFYRCLRPDD